MNIEKATAADIFFLNTIASRAIIESVQANDEVKQKTIADTARHIDENISRDDCVFLKFSNDADVLGFILIQEFWNLSDLFVLPEWHGKGIGAALFNAAKVACLSNGHRGYIRLYSSLNAEKFYRRLGFENFDPGKSYPDFVVPLEYRLE